MPFYLKIPGLDIEKIPQGIRTFVFHKFFRAGMAKRGSPEPHRSSGILRLQRWIQSVSNNRPRDQAFLIFTIDVDTSYTFRRHGEPIRRMLEERGCRAAWYFLTGKYPVESSFLDSLQRSGHEIGWHGHKHDHRLGFLARAERRAQLEQARAFFERYDVAGMRAPHFLWTRALHEDVSPLLAYDTSFHDAYPFSEEGIGCATSLPFRMPCGLWQIPITITSDHFFPPSSSISERLNWMRAQLDAQIDLGGVVHLVLHPEPSITLKPRNLELLRLFLNYVDERRGELMHCLPRELVEHSRRAEQRETC